MADKFSILTVWNDDHSRFITSKISRERGNAMLRVLDGLDQPQSSAQSDYLLRVKSIYPTLSEQYDPHTSHVTAEQAKEAYWNDLDAAKAYNPAEKLLNEGIPQGKSMALPENDR
jgi:hypothetical protein